MGDRFADAEPQVIHSDVSAELFFAFPPTSAEQHLIDGLLYISPPATQEHGDVVHAVAVAMKEAAEPGGRVLRGMDCWLSDSTVIRPDAAYLVAERARLASRYVQGAPDLVVEVHSPGTRRFDTEAKFEAYGRDGVREAWFIDPEARTITVVSGDGTRWVLEAAVAWGEVLPSAVLPGVGTAGLG